MFDYDHKDLLKIYDQPLVQGRLIRRYKRFLADVRLDDGSETIAHCANSGSMMGLAEAGAPVWLSANGNPKAKLDYRWEVSHQKIDGEWIAVGINTSRPNKMIAEILKQNPQLLNLPNQPDIIAEKTVEKGTRLDLYTHDQQDREVYIEVKSVTLRRVENDQNIVEFPDARTERGSKHMRSLASLSRNGLRAVLIYCIQRADCQTMKIADDIDPDYHQAVQEAKDAGVEILPLVFEPSLAGAIYRGHIPLVIK